MAGRLVTWTAGLSGPWLYLVITALAFGETALFLDFVVPGDFGMVVTGAAAKEADVPLAGLIAVGSVGAVAGDSVSFLIGRRYGRRIVNRFPFLRRHVEPKFDRAERFFERRGGVAVLGARWVGAFRAVVPAVAGSAGMSYRRFFLWNLVASISWVGTTTTLGWLFGRRLADTVDNIGSLISVVVVVALLTGWWFLRRRRSARSGEEPGRDGDRRRDDPAADHEPVRKPA